MFAESFHPKTHAKFNVEFKSVYRKIGKINSSRELQASRLGLVNDQKYFFLIHWPKNWQFFSLSANPVQVVEQEIAGPKSKGPPGFSMFGSSKATEPSIVVNFSNDLAILRSNMIKMLGLQKVEASFSDFEQNRNFLFRETLGSELLRFTFRLDTDSQSFLRWTNPNIESRLALGQAINNEEFWLSLTCTAFPISENASPLNAPKVEECLGLQITPCRELQKCAGHVSFDFGNNGSTIAFIPNGARSANSIELVSAEPLVSGDAQSPTDTLVSAIRVTGYTPPTHDESDPENKKGVFASAEWNIGKDAVKYGKGALVDGLKKLLADPDPMPLINLELDMGDRSMPKSTAAELYLSSLFQAFHRQKLSLAMPLTVTYPSTYSQREIFRLLKAITRSFYRSLKHPALPEGKVSDLAGRLLKTYLDEASAAAIYFIYRDFIEGPGQTAGFKYLYPDGVNLLLYDCGGGTTDISLIHAGLKLTQRTETRDGQEHHHEVWQVKLNVIGRTGQRSFGGDDITAAVFLAAKWMLAHIVSSSAIEQPTVEIARNLKSHKELKAKLNAILPTAWMSSDLKTMLVNDENKIKQRKSLTHEFANYSERLKEWISSDRATRGNAPDITGGTELSRELEKAGKIKFPEILAKFKDKAGDLEAIVDAMIQPQIDLSIEAANNLIRDRLVKPTSGPARPLDTTEDVDVDIEDESRRPLVLAPDGCMHWLYIVGQASLYPLVSKRLRESSAVADLAPSWLDESRMVFEQDSLKNAVVKGAALARMAVTTVEDTEFVWDVSLSERLAFDVGLKLAGRGPRLLFEENQYYDKLEPFWLETVTGALDGQSLRLYRRWPGMPRMERNEEWQPYILFEFPEPPAGRICIYYDSRKSREGEPAFCVYVESSKKEYVGIELTEDRFIPPLQRGDL